MKFDDWDLIPEGSQDTDGTLHMCAPLQVSSLPTSSRTSSTDILPAAPKSRPLQRPDTSCRPRIRATLQLNSPCNSLDSGMDVSRAMFVDISQLQHAEPLQRPTPTSVPVTSAPMPDTPNPFASTSDAEWLQAIRWAAIAIECIIRCRDSITHAERPN